MPDLPDVPPEAEEDAVPDIPDIPDELVWRELGRQETTRFVSGAVFGGRIYGGTHFGGTSAIYDYPPFELQQQFGGESVLDFGEYAGVLFSAHENGPRVYRLAGDEWTLAFEHGDGWVYMFFMTVFRSTLVVSGGTVDFIGLVGTGDGSTFPDLAVMPGWNWLPVVYRDELYMLGHAGSAYAPEGASAVRSADGVAFATVDALSGGPEYQCGYVWNDLLFLGTGGWTTDRTGTGLAFIYAFDGTSRTQVFSGDRNGVTDIIAFRGSLYATVDAGWETPDGDSALYESPDGAAWSLLRTFPDPELRHLEVVDDSALVVYGGRAGGYGVIYIWE